MNRGVFVLAGVVAAGCGDNARHADGPADAAAPDASGVGAHTSCVATFSDNFNDRWDGPRDCAAITTDAATGDAWLGLSVPSRYLGVPFDIAIDLGATPGTGTYTSAQATGLDWHVTALQEFNMTSCLYQAGAGLVPPGTYTLTVDTLDATGVHGTLDLALYVLSRPYTYCGERTTEQLHVAF